MAIPQGLNLTQLTRYQGVAIAELACMFIFYLILKIVHFCKWGHLYTDPDEESEGTPSATQRGKKPTSTKEYALPYSEMVAGNVGHLLSHNLRQPRDRPRTAAAVLSQHLRGCDRLPPLRTLLRHSDRQRVHKGRRAGKGAAHDSHPHPLVL